MSFPTSVFSLESSGNLANSWERGQLNNWCGTCSTCKFIVLYYYILVELGSFIGEEKFLLTMANLSKGPVSLLSSFSPECANHWWIFSEFPEQCMYSKETLNSLIPDIVCHLNLENSAFTQALILAALTIHTSVRNFKSFSISYRHACIP